MEVVSADDTSLDAYSLDTPCQVTRTPNIEHGPSNLRLSWQRRLHQALSRGRQSYLTRFVLWHGHQSPINIHHTHQPPAIMASLARTHHHCSPRRPREPFLQYLARYKTWSSYRACQSNTERETLRLARLPTPDSDDSDSGDAMFSITEMSHLRTNPAVQSPHAAIANLSPPVDHGSPPAYSHAPHNPAPASATESLRRAAPLAAQAPRSKPRPRTRRQPCRKPVDSNSRVRKSAPYLRSRARISPVSLFVELDIHGQARPVQTDTGVRRRALGGIKGLRRGKGRAA